LGTKLGVGEGGWMFMILVFLMCSQYVFTIFPKSSQHIPQVVHNKKKLGGEISPLGKLKNGNANLVECQVVHLNIT
jgi:hypothetical protein